MVYINDLDELQLQGETFLYADDTSLFYSSTSINLNILKAQSDLVKLERFFTENGLPLNADKTKLLNFSSNKRTTHVPYIQLKVNDQVVETVSSFRYLGLTLDSHLTWSDHIESVSEKIKPISGMMYRARDMLTKDVKLMVYHSMFHSAMTYMIELWGGASYTYLKPIQVLQNRAVRNIYELPVLEPRVLMYERPEVRVLPLRGIYEYALCSLVFKTIRGECNSRISFNAAMHDYPSRGSQLLTKPKCKLELCKRRIGYAGPSSYNNLPEQCRNAVNITRFKKLSHEYLKDRIFNLLLHF